MSRPAPGGRKGPDSHLRIFVQMLRLLPRPECGSNVPFSVTSSRAQTSGFLTSGHSAHPSPGGSWVPWGCAGGCGAPRTWDSPPGTCHGLWREWRPGHMSRDLCFHWMWAQAPGPVNQVGAASWWLRPPGAVGQERAGALRPRGRPLPAGPGEEVLRRVPGGLRPEAARSPPEPGGEPREAAF